MPSSPTFPADRVTLRRALGRWDLTAIGINQVIGGAIFLMPAPVAAQLGDWSVVGFVLAGMASLLVALCFAEVSSRFESTGGPSLYARAAFGRFAGFEVGWMQWFTRVASQASVVNGLALAVGFFWHTFDGGAARMLLITSVILALTWINVRGIRQSSFLVNLLTIGKLLPLGIFIAIGLFQVNYSRVVPSASLSLGQAGAGALLLMYVFGGYDVVPVAAGEAKEPRRHVPFALVTTILGVTVLMALAQTVAQGTLPDIARSRTPIADSAFAFMGSGGALMVGVGSVLSMTGHNAGAVLSGSRMLFALAENRDLPSWFARIHPRFRTPANCVLVTSAVALALALSGTFEKLATASAVARLVPYAAACGSTLMLRRSRFSAVVRPATFVIPFGPVVPFLGLLVSIAIMSGATWQQLLGGLSSLVVGAALFAIGAVQRHRSSLSTLLWK